jgi:hypothetical protein
VTDEYDLLESIELLRVLEVIAQQIRVINFLLQHRENSRWRCLARSFLMQPMRKSINQESGVAKWDGGFQVCVR